MTMTTTTTNHDEQPYYRLSPDTVIDAAESVGLLSDYRVLALNSFENRVYQVGLEEAEPVIIKFYRPERWSDAQIIEEHRFSQELVDTELPIVAPLAIAGNTLHEYQGYRFTAYPRRGGHPLNVDDMDVLFRMGQWLGRIHAIGALRPFEHRNTLDVMGQLREDMAFLQTRFIPDGLQEAYRSLADDLLDTLQRRLGELPASSFMRLHGDCHAGNILWRDNKPWFVDFDDCINGPAIQDIWMLLWGSRPEQERQLSEISEGYNEFYDFDASQLGWIEILRSYRIVHQAAWVGRRWGDPAFPRAFTWFDTPRYWPDHILEMREQLAALQEPPLTLWS